MQLIVEKRGYRVLPLIALAIAVGLLVLISRDSLAVTNPGGFEIDNTCNTAAECTTVLSPANCAASNTAALPSIPCKASYYANVNSSASAEVNGDDWATDGSSGVGVPVFFGNTSGSPDFSCYGSNISVNPAISGTVRLICDGFGSTVTGISETEDNIVHAFSGSAQASCEQIPCGIYPITNNTLGTPKDELTHVYYVQRQEDVTGTPDAGCGGLPNIRNVVIIGIERVNNSGDSHWSIELDAKKQTNISSLANNTGTPFDLVFDRSDGDVLMSIDLTGGGGNPDISPFSNVGNTGSGTAAFDPLGTPPCSRFSTATNLLDQTAPPWNGPFCDATVTDTGANSCRIVNGAGEGPGTPCGPKVAGKTTAECTIVPPTDFVEVAIDTTSFGIPLTCFASAVITTRSSPQGGGDIGEANVKDIAATELPECAVSWEKRDGSVTGHPLQGGATFTVTPNPYGGASLLVSDCIVSPCAAGGDTDPDAGQFSLANVNPGTYSVCETTPPSGYAADADLCRSVSVSSASPTAVIGLQGTDDHSDGDGTGSACSDATLDPTGDECDFHNRLGSVEWEKRDDQGALQAGATFNISPNPYACHSPAGTNPSPISDDADSTDGPAGDGDEDGTGGQLKLDRVCIGNYTITEATPPSGFALDDDTTRTCNVTATDLVCAVGTQGTPDDCPDTTPAGDGDETDFCNRLGTIEWEKRDDQGVLQGGATFTVGPNPFDCHNGIVGDDTTAVTVKDNDSPDADPDAGQLKLERVCLGTYTITETVPPDGFALDDDPTREIIVSATELNPVVGTTDTNDIGDTDEHDFGNRLGTIEWEKRDDQGVLQGGATFTVGPNPFDCHNGIVGDETTAVTVLDNTAPDAAAASGQLKLERVCLGTYTITETVPPDGFALDDDPTREIIVSATELNPVVGTTDTNDIGDTDEHDFGNRLGTIEWEKRDDQGVLQGGATFTVGPNPFDCHNGIVGDDTAAVTVKDNDPPDADPDAGQLKLERVCLGTYTITETVPPPGFALDDDPTREIIVSATELNPVVGTTDFADCADFATDESDFCNRLGTIEWEKRDDQGVLQGGATFTVGPNPFDCHDGIVGNDTAAVTVVDDSGPDVDSDSGQLKLDRVCLGTYTITETVPPDGFALDDDPTREIIVSSTELNPVVGTTDTNDIGDTDEHDFGNRLGTIEWEKRDDQGVLQGGATFTVGPNPFDCHNGIVGDDTTAVTVKDNDPPDADPDAGQLKLERVCLGTYTITETVPPDGFALDDDPTREIIVSSTELNPVVGTTDTNDIGDTDEHDFGNRLGTIEWEKRDDLEALQGGAQFAITPNPFECHGGADPGTFTDNGGPDTDTDDGQFKLERVCLGTYMVCEQVAPTGFARDDSLCRSVTVSATELNPVIGATDAIDCANDVQDEQDFCNRLGSLEWEKRSDINGELLAGATFEVSPNPFACRGAGSDPLVVTDDVDPALPDTDPVDEDDDGGQFKLSRVCMGTYTITETVPPPTFAEDPDDTRTCQVDDPTFAGGSNELNCAIGTQDVADDCPDADDANDTDDSDFCNLIGSLYWEKRGKDASTPETGNELLTGFGFTVTGTDVNIVVTDCTSGPCPAGGDQNPDGGKFCLDEMPIGVLLTIDETSKVTGYIQTAPENDGDLTLTLTTSSTCAGTPDDAGDFINQPISQFKIDFICVAYSPTGSGACATSAKITCPTPAISPTPDDLTPDDFDDISETYGNATATLLEGTYDCTIVIDP